MMSNKMCSLQFWPSQSLKILRYKYGHNNQTCSSALLRRGNGSEEGVLGVRFLSSVEIKTALKPFFFAVHPDKFGQFPSERDVNENSLKQLNAYIESSEETSHRSTPTHLTFYLRPSSPPPPPSPPHGSADPKREESSGGGQSKFQTIIIDLSNGTSPHSKRKIVNSILKECKLPTSYLDSIPSPQSEPMNPSAFNKWAKGVVFRPRGPRGTRGGFDFEHDFHRTEFYDDIGQNFKNFEQNLKSSVFYGDHLEGWLRKNSGKSRKKLEEFRPIRDEISRIQRNLCESLQIKDIIWDCGWGLSHFRASLESLAQLEKHHPDKMVHLKGKTLIFGMESGVSLSGQIILNSGEVRRNWLDTIQNVSKYDDVILRIPSVQQALSRSLKDIKVVHRKYETNRMADSYEQTIRKLVTSIGDFKARRSFPKTWPESLSDLELVVETDAGPLMVSPTGQIVTPSSCPPPILIDFISNNMEKARIKLEQYKKERYEEEDLLEQCKTELGLLKLEKDDSVNPSYMIECCQRLLKRSNDLAPLLKGTQLLITNYYSVLSEGDLCIPWDFKDSRSEDSSAREDENTRERSYSTSW